MSYNQGGYGNRGYTGQAQDAYAPPRQQYGQEEHHNQNPYANYTQQQNQAPPRQQHNGSYEMQDFEHGGEAPPEILSDLTARIDEAQRQLDNVLALRKTLLEDIAGGPPREQLNQKIEAASAQARYYNKDLVQFIRELKGKYPGSNAIAFQGDKLKKIATAFTKEEHIVAGALKQQIKRQVDIAYGDSMTESKKNEMVENGNTQVFQSAVMSSRRGQAQNALNAAKERQIEIERIAQEMEVLLQLFEDMSALVQEQDALVTKIADNAEQTQVHMEEGVKNLDSGIEKAKSARRKKWWCLLIVVVLIVIIIIVIMVVVVKPIIQESNKNKRSLEYLALARRSIIDGLPSERLNPSAARRALLE